MQKVIFTVVAMLIVSYVALEVSQTIAFLKKSHDLGVAATAYSREVENPTERVLIVGDSTGVGVGASDPLYSLGGRLGTEFPTLSIVNLSESGADIEDVKEMVRQNIAEDFDTVIILIGTNDILGRKSPAQIRPHLDETLSLAGEVAGREVILIPPQNIAYLPAFPPLADLYFKSVTQKMHQDFSESARQNGAVVVDIFTDKKSNQLSQDFYAQDRMHLNDKGYEFLYQKLREVMDREGIRFGESED